MTKISAIALAVAVFVAGCAENTGAPSASSGPSAEAVAIAAQLPFMSDDMKARIASSYDRKRGSWAIAVSDNGRNWAFPWGTGLTEAEVQRRALERCEHTSGKPCYLAAETAGITYQDGDRPQSANLQYDGAFDPARVPFVRDEVRAEGMIGTNDAAFAARSANRAMVITSNGWWYTVDNQSSEQAAAEAALAKCKASQADQNTPRPCILYAVNDKVVFARDAPLY